MPTVSLTTTIEALRDILEGLTYLSGGIGRVLIHQPKVKSKTDFEALWGSEANVTSTVWLIWSSRTVGEWPDTPGVTLTRNHSITVHGYRPYVGTEAAQTEWRELCDYVHQQLSLEAYIQLGITLTEGIRVGPWTLDSRENDIRSNVEMFECVLSATLLNSVESLE